MLLRGHTELVVEGVVPDLLHVVPVGDDAVLDGILEGEDATLGLGLVTDVGVLLAHAHHHALGKRQVSIITQRSNGARSKIFTLRPMFRKIGKKLPRKKLIFY